MEIPKDPQILAAAGIFVFVASFIILKKYHQTRNQNRGYFIN